LNKELKNSLRFYSSPEYKEMNSKVRGNIMLNKELKDHYDNILDIFDGVPYLKTSLVVYRGMKKYIKYENQGFISTSLDKNIAKSFNTGSCCLYIITLTPGQYGVLPLESVSEMPEEKEILLPPGKLSIQLVVPYSESGENMDVVYCTYIPNGTLIINENELNNLNNEKIDKIKITLSIESWVERIINTNIKEEVELLCDESLDLNQCIIEQLKTIDFYDDIPEKAISKFISLFSNLSNVIKNTIVNK
jgi:hypothetical protein